MIGKIDFWPADGPIVESGVAFLSQDCHYVNRPPNARPSLAKNQLETVMCVEGAPMPVKGVFWSKHMCPLIQVICSVKLSCVPNSLDQHQCCQFLEINQLSFLSLVFSFVNRACYQYMMLRRSQQTHSIHAVVLYVFHQLHHPLAVLVKARSVYNSMCVILSAWCWPLTGKICTTSSGLHFPSQTCAFILHLGVWSLFLLR